MHTRGGDAIAKRSYCSNNSMARSQLFCLYFGCHTSIRHRSDDIFQGIRPVFLLQSLGLFLPHLSCLELRSPCVSLKIIAHLRTFFSQSDSSIQRPRSINCFTAYLPANQNPVFRRTMVQIYSNRESTQKCILSSFPQVAPNLYEFRSSVEHKRPCFEECCNQTISGPHWLP